MDTNQILFVGDFSKTKKQEPIKANLTKTEMIKKSAIEHMTRQLNEAQWRNREEHLNLGELIY